LSQRCIGGVDGLLGLRVARLERLLGVTKGALGRRRILFRLAQYSLTLSTRRDDGENVRALGIGRISKPGLVGRNSRANRLTRGQGRDKGILGQVDLQISLYLSGARLDL